MLELLVFPKKGERHPVELFFVGFLYSTLAYLIVKLIFSKDVVLSESSGILIVMFTSLFSIIFFFFALRRDERENLKDNSRRVVKDDWKMLKMLLYLFLGFMAGFLLWQVIFPQEMAFNSQMETYCVINKPLQYKDCLDSNRMGDTLNGINANMKGELIGIFANNVLVSLVILVFSVLFGAAVIFIIAWNASIVSTVVAYSARYQFSDLPFWLLRFMIHGIPEIAGYFLMAMAGGISSFAISSYFRDRIMSKGLMKVIRRAIAMAIVAILVLIIAALLEVYVSPLIG